MLFKGPRQFCLAGNLPDGSYWQLALPEQACYSPPGDLLAVCQDKSSVLASVYHTFIRLSGYSLLAVKAALFMFRIFPPPASGTDILAGSYGTGTGLAPDTGEALIVQWIVGYPVSFNIVLKFFFAPVEQGIEFDKAEFGIPLYHPYLLTGDGLVAPKPADPDIKPPKGSLTDFTYPI